MKILIIGGNGTLGKIVRDHYKAKHEVLIAGRNSGDVQIDLADNASIQQGLEKAHEKTGKLDAIICIAGEAKWAPFAELTEDDYYIGLRSKLMGQVNLVRIGQNFLNPEGSITLTTGILADDPVIKTASAAMVNGAIHSFVQAAALEIKDFRLNVVCPGLVEDSVEKYRDYFPGHHPIPMQKMLRGFIRCVEGHQHGEIVKIYE
ncbi:short chain dehydrogenase [marine bacterium AO1-C]|nr:short chain dehydrogenase [marine bacterium AO1-C]